MDVVGASNSQINTREGQRSRKEGSQLYVLLMPSHQQLARATKHLQILVASSAGGISPRTADFATFVD